MVATLLLDAAVDSIAFEKIALGDVGSPDVDKPFAVRVVGPESAGVRITGLGNELVCLDATSIAAGLLARKSAVSARKLDGYGIEITHRFHSQGPPTWTPPPTELVHAVKARTGWSVSACDQPRGRLQLRGAANSTLAGS